MYDRVVGYYEGVRNLEEERTSRIVEMFMFLASGKADALSGRSISNPENTTDLLSRVEQIEQKDLYTLRLRN